MISVHEPKAIVVDYAGFAKLVPYAIKTLRTMRSKGLLPPSHKLGGKRLWLVEDIRLWAEWGFPAEAEFVARMADAATNPAESTCITRSTSLAANAMSLVRASSKALRRWLSPNRSQAACTANASRIETTITTPSTANRGHGNSGLMVTSRQFVAF